MNSPQSPIQNFLKKIELAGNKLPHPTSLFIIFIFIILWFSWITAYAGISTFHPVSGKAIEATNLLSQFGLHQMLKNTVSNFTSFAPLGTVLIAMLGIGIAEKAGLLAAALRALVLSTPARLLSSTIVFAGIMSSLAADAGYVVLIPLAGILFQMAGRNPLIGIAACFAGVSGGYSANLLIGPVDAILAGLSTEAIRFVDSNYTVNEAGNYYFIVASTFLITIIGTLVTEKIVAPLFENKDTEDEGIILRSSENEDILLTPEEKKALKATLAGLIILTTLLLAATVPESAILRNPETGSLLKSPFISGIVTIIAVFIGLLGLIFGFVSGTFKNDRDVIHSMETTMETMASYLVLMFFAAQLLAYFKWSQLGPIVAIKGALLLQGMDLNPVLLMVCFVGFAATINLLIGSASAKWSMLAPIFVPMFFLVGISPEATQAAFRIGDSSTNIITPLMPYFAIVVAYVQRYDKEAGMGTLIAMMLPFSIVFMVCWTTLFASWLALGINLGPGAAGLLP